MIVLEAKEVENCVNLVTVYDLILSDSFSKDNIYKLGALGRFQYFPEFPKPFFKIQIGGICDIKGIEGNKIVRATLKNPKEYTIQYVIDLINNA